MDNSQSIFVGSNKLFTSDAQVLGTQIKIGGEEYYKISNVEQMRPFFMSIVSYSNHWMFISSNGGLSAGRTHRDNALFPYYTDDKLTEFAEITGSKTLIKIAVGEKIFLWEPFSAQHSGAYNTHRNLYKNAIGNKVIFEECNEDLGLIFQYHWSTSDKFGFVKKSVLKNTNGKLAVIEILDGIQNIMPYGLDSVFQATTSNLIDAYKKSELEVDSGLGIYALSAIIVDRAEPSEALKATTVWSLGLNNAKYLLSSLQLDSFRRGGKLGQELDIKAEKGAYFIHSELELGAKEQKEWLLVAEVSQSVVAVNEIKKQIAEDADLAAKIQKDIDEGTRKLVELTGNADGIQLTADNAKDMRHFSNTLFNIMRGGVFDDNYQIEKYDFVAYLEKANTLVFKAKEKKLEGLNVKFSLQDLRALAENDEDKNFQRLCLEYMPLKFSRRHGDPSRPWNKFSINTKNETDGAKILDYEGNWRDIFQNWEALAHSYPEFIDSMIHKFLNATTFDGYNPYRVTKDGFDWETIEVDDPWSYIGYWGDHQIIYLLKFLEFSEKYYPGKLATYSNEDIFVYANVPYKIKKYAEILKNPKDTIDFDFELDEKIRADREIFGADAALLKDEKGNIYQVNFIEKILATILAKLANFIPEAGIWMNTQRPEWNDANNALVGNGVSMVTLYYLRRFLHFFDNLLVSISSEKIELSQEFVVFFEKMSNSFVEDRVILTGKISDKKRKLLMDKLGEAASSYRADIYEKGFSAKKQTISKKDLKDFITVGLEFLEHSIAANKREDKLYHAYNLMTIENDAEVLVSYLPEMLEGQVAALSSGYVTSQESLELLNALKNSKLFREDQYSYILYPNKELPRFVDKNNIPTAVVAQSELLQKLENDGNKHILEKDVFGNYHFNGTFNNANSLREALARLSKEYQSLVKKEQEFLLQVFEEIFNHKAFTGRSGTFFGYEGLGSIYWHMVSKLAVAVQETCLRAIEGNEEATMVGKLLEHYYEINEGLGVHKSPQLYGAFPTDPYSHTPGTKGAQQPGMTGQVKEDILTRFSELGISVKEGKLYFQPYNLLRKEEFLVEKKQFHYQTLDKETKVIVLESGSLCFSYCQVPIIYVIADTEQIEIAYKNGTKRQFLENSLAEKESRDIFQRTGNIERITVRVKNEKLR